MHITQTEEAVRLLEGKVPGVKGDFTLNDAATITGLAVDEAKEALNAIMGKYVCRLRVTENGDLIYSFGASLQRRGEKTFAEKLEAVRDWAWKIFTVIFKAWIAVTLVVYFVVFVVILIALLVAASSSRDSDRKSSGNMDGIFNLFISIFQWRAVTNVISYQTDSHGYAYRSYESRKSELFRSKSGEPKKHFIASVYDFVFGPARVERDPLGNEKEVAAYLRREKGIVTPSELIGLAGWTRPQAEAFLSECLVRFQGDPVISDNGVVYGKFDQITRGFNDVKESNIELYWDEYEPDYELTGNRIARNASIIFMNSFNLFFASAILWMFYYSNPTFGTSYDEQISLFLGWLPFLFSILFIAVPIFRLPGVWRSKRRRTAMNIRKRVMRFLFRNKELSATLDEILNGVNAGTEIKLTRSEIEECVRLMMIDFEGETKLTDDGKIVYFFQRMAEELTEAVQLKATRQLDNKLGKVI